MTWAAEQQRAGMTQAHSQQHWAQTEGFSKTHGSNVEVLIPKHTFQNYLGFVAAQCSSFSCAKFKLCRPQKHALYNKFNPLTMKGHFINQYLIH